MRQIPNVYPHRLAVVLDPRHDGTLRGPYTFIRWVGPVCRARSARQSSTGCARSRYASCGSWARAELEAGASGGRLFVVHVDVRSGDWLSPGQRDRFVYGAVTDAEDVAGAPPSDPLLSTRYHARGDGCPMCGGTGRIRCATCEDQDPPGCTDCAGGYVECPAGRLSRSVLEGDHHGRDQ